MEFFYGGLAIVVVELLLTIVGRSNNRRRRSIVAPHRVLPSSPLRRTQYSAWGQPSAGDSDDVAVTDQLPYIEPRSTLGEWGNTTLTNSGSWPASQASNHQAHRQGGHSGTTHHSGGSGHSTHSVQHQPTQHSTTSHAPVHTPSTHFHDGGSFSGGHH